MSWKYLKLDNGKLAETAKPETADANCTYKPVKPKVIYKDKRKPK